MTISQSLVSKLWWGPFRRPFEAIARRTIKNRSKILFGPMSGLSFIGGISQILGIYELHMQRVLLDKLNEGDTLYDIGANNGYLSLMGSKKVGRRGFVYAIEPLPHNANKIRRVIFENKITNCEVVQLAVSNLTGEAQFYIDNGGDTSTASLMKRNGNQALNVHTTTLDRFVGQHRWPSLIKVDVEGAEALVLQGASELLSSDAAPIWLIENHSKENDRCVKQLLESHGYHTHPLVSIRRKLYPRHLLAWKDLRK